MCGGKLLPNYWRQTLSRWPNQTNSILATRPCYWLLPVMTVLWLNYYLLLQWLIIGHCYYEWKLMTLLEKKTLTAATVTLPPSIILFLVSHPRQTAPAWCVFNMTPGSWYWAWPCAIAWWLSATAHSTSPYPACLILFIIILDQEGLLVLIPLVGRITINKIPIIIVGIIVCVENTDTIVCGLLLQPSPQALCIVFPAPLLLQTGCGVYDNYYLHWPELTAKRRT